MECEAGNLTRVKLCVTSFLIQYAVIRSAIAILIFATWTTCNAQKSIDRKDVLLIGGIKQVIWIKGDDDRKPIFLFLHGGPGSSVMSYARKFSDELYKHFIVVHWDQRESGKTLKLNPSPVPLTARLFADDAGELVDSLLIRFDRKKLFIAGHSWGTYLGFHLVRTKPEKIEAYIAIGAMVDQLESERIALAKMKSNAVASNDSVSLGEFNQIEIPFRTGEQLYFHRKGLYQLNGSTVPFTQSYVTNWAVKWLSVFNEASAENLFETLPKITCPVYFFAGRNDLQTNSAVVEKYFNHVSAATKRFYWFENTGHSIPSAQGKRMQAIIINEILNSSGNQKSND